MADKQKIFDDVKEERKYQDKKWGLEFDKNNTANDWSSYIMTYLANASAMPTGSPEYRKLMIKVAALSVAAIEIADDKFMPIRHYE
jgi:hypothetical protein